MSETFKRNVLIETWRKQADDAANRSAAIVDFLREHGKRGDLDPKYVHEQLIRLGDGQALIFASLRSLGSVMASMDIQIQKMMKAAGVQY